MSGDEIYPSVIKNWDIIGVKRSVSIIYDKQDSIKKGRRYLSEKDSKEENFSNPIYRVTITHVTKETILKKMM